MPVEPSTLPPRPASQTSIPALLTSLQSEYDAIMLESLQIKKEFQSSRSVFPRSIRCRAMLIAAIGKNLPTLCTVRMLRQGSLRVC